MLLKSGKGNDWRVIFLLFGNIAQKFESVLLLNRQNFWEILKTSFHLSRVYLYLRHNFLTGENYLKPSLIKLWDKTSKHP